jgi:hypothetical protein
MSRVTSEFFGVTDLCMDGVSEACLAEWWRHLGAFRGKLRVVERFAVDSSRDSALRYHAMWSLLLSDVKQISNVSTNLVPPPYLK